MPNSNNQIYWVNNQIYLVKQLNLSSSNTQIAFHNPHMKPRPSTLFSTKFATCLSKLRQPSTIEVGHQQFKQLLINTDLKDIIGPFVSKMDTVDRPTERQKKEHAKLYIELIDHFGEEILLQSFYEKFMESLVKKTVSVGDVIGHLCKGYISRIHPLENTKNYVIYITTLFKSHIQIPKIIKQLAQTLSSQILRPLQNDMIQLLIDKMPLSRQKAEHIQAMMAVVLGLEDKFECEHLVQPVLVKHLKHEDWSVRKACVDICYSLMVVKEEINSVLHEIIKELKYDKIKNVRDSVSNYESLYKQVYGEDQSFKPQIYSQKTLRSHPRTAKSPYRQSQHIRTQQDYAQSPNKIVGKIRNETFFKNAKDSNVIRVSDDLHENLSGINFGNRTHFINEQAQHDQPETLKHNRSLHLSQSPSLKPNIKRGSTNNLLSQQIKSNKLEQNPAKESPKFNLNFDKLKNTQTEFKEHQKMGKPYLSDFGSKLPKKQLKTLPYETDEQNLNFSLESEDNERRQYMPIKKSELKNYGEKEEAIFKGERQQRQQRQQRQARQARQSRQARQQRDHREQKPTTKVVTENNTFFLPKSTSSGVSTPSLKQSLNPAFNNQHTLSTQKPPTSNNFNSVPDEGQSFGTRIDLMQVKTMFDKFQERVMNRLDKIQARVASLENSQMKLSFGRDTQPPVSGEKHKVLESLEDSRISLKNEHFFPYEDNNLFKKQHKASDIHENDWLILNEQESHNNALESNLIQKLNEALKSHNIDEAFSLVLANNKLSLLMKLLDSLHIPTDRTVQECLLLEIKKQANKKEVLKWLKNYLIERGQTIQKSPNSPVFKLLLKIRTELMKQQKLRERDYELLKTMVLNEMEELFDQSGH